MEKTVFLFPGQGAQYVGMGKSLCEMSAAARRTFEEANDALGFDLKKLCFEGNLDELTRTENTQPALLTAGVVAFRVYQEEIGAAPDFAAGHSLGEYTALCCGGAISFADAVRVVRLRGRFMQEAVAPGVGGMAAVSGVPRALIQEECTKVSKDGLMAVVSNDNAPDQIVISGHLAAVNAAGDSLAAKGARVVPLKVSAPFHSPLMQPAAERLQEELQRLSLGTLTFKVLSNVKAVPYTGTEEIVENLTAQLVSPVRWTESMAFLKAQGVKKGIEMGPQAVLKNLMQKNAPDIRIFSFETAEDVRAAKRAFAQNFENTLEVLTKCIAAAVCTKNRNFNAEEYQTGVAKPYNALKEMKAVLVKDGAQPDTAQLYEALEGLKTIFAAKKLPVAEQTEIFEEILDSTETKTLLNGFKMPEEKVLVHA